MGNQVENNTTFGLSERDSESDVYLWECREFQVLPIGIESWADFKKHAKMMERIENKGRFSYDISKNRKTSQDGWKWKSKIRKKEIGE